MSNISTVPPECENRWQPRRRRREQRAAYDALVQVLAPCTGMGVALNVSDSGLRMVVDCELEEGACCELRLIDRNGCARIERMRVAWSRRLRDGSVVGLERLATH
jgi:hypothetical protein